MRLNSAHPSEASLYDQLITSCNQEGSSSDQLITSCDQEGSSSDQETSEYINKVSRPPPQRSPALHHHPMH